MKRERKKQPTGLAAHFALIVLTALIIPVTINFLLGNGELIAELSERAAVLAVAVNMPDAGLDMLQERFHDQLFDEDLNHLPQFPVPDIRQPEPAIQNPESDAASPSPPRIPDQYAAPLLSENFAATGSGLISYGNGYIRNETYHDDEDVLEILETPMPLTFADTDEPQVLIIHTHATESFERYDTDVYDTRNTWRSTDNNTNMVAVGAAMAEVLEQNGIGVIHDTTQHDYPSYNGSYERSAETIQRYLDEYPSIRIVLDLHRDAMERENQTIVKPVIEIDGQNAAQIMIISGCDDGTMDMPGWPNNLRFAAAFQDAMEQQYPELTRPVYFCYRKYNQHLTPGSLLLEFGSNANTLDEAIYSATLCGQALADLIKEYTE